MAVLGKDAGRQEDYSKVAGSGKVSVVQNVPAAVLDQEYVKSTRTLSEQIRRYATMVGVREVQALGGCSLLQRQPPKAAAPPCAQLQACCADAPADWAVAAV